jgi:hypothetical protein
MASQKRKIKPVVDDSYSALEIYCIWLNEYYKALRKSGFVESIALTIMMDKISYPDWVSYKMPKDVDIQNYLDDEDED